MSQCHSSARCDDNQRVMINGVERQATVHNIHGVEGYRTLFGFVKEDSGGRKGVRLLSDSEVWKEYEGSGL